VPGRHRRKNILPVVATEDDVVDGIGKMDTEFTSHAGMIAEEYQEIKRDQRSANGDETHETRHPRAGGNDEFHGKMDKTWLIAPPASFFISVLSLQAVPIALLLLLLFFLYLFLGLRFWRPLLTLCISWLLFLLLDCRTSLLGRCWTLGILLLPWTSHPRLILLFPLGRCGRFLFNLLKVLTDYRFLRLVTVLLAVDRMLLLRPAGVPLS
jgi:hypothetical protein